MRPEEEILGILKESLQKKNGSSLVLSIRKKLLSFDPLIGEHSINVAAYAEQIGSQLGFSSDDHDRLVLAALLHDIGKVFIPPEILYKTSVLNNEEWEVVQQHPYQGSNLLKPFNRLKDIILTILHHHEFYNGRGYPGKIAREDIPIFSRIISVSDAYEAMTSGRPFRRGFSHREAVNRLKEGRGTQFDPRIVAQFIKRF
ncbi:HD-GYP domain-containing protein [Pelotomaculum propionicicum]|uniref:Cyclic di-GMP phosphodiesterase response regulator RpfG n=1 Tax=Pelotomaculum propionicicum TaxID=258475 RepID=A0A4Y7RU36_9FIRM|nr:HD-GYP domain-containing protein [Pelotomaculum propionicicum]TEB12391.1 Cyclic di-GMP phosphodiesterase response regulator RpfG [Pelotomaculum propionicicum]